MPNPLHGRANLSDTPSPVGVVGLGYVGLPLMVTFAEAGRRSSAWTSPSASCRSSTPAARTSRTSRASDSRRLSLPDRSGPPGTGPTWPPARRWSSACPRRWTRTASPTCRSSSRPRSSSPRICARQLVVLESTTYPGTTRGELRGALENGIRAEGGRGLPPGLLTGARRPGAPRLHDEEHAEGRGRPHAGVHPRAAELYGALLRPRGRRRKPRGGRDDEAPREHLPRRQHRPRQRARDAVRPDEHRHLGGHRRRRRPSPSASCRSVRARASAATASRSTPSTSPGRPASSSSTPSSSSWPGRSTRRCPSSASARWRGR